jgi:hypothetical protein
MKFLMVALALALFGTSAEALKALRSHED